MAGSLAEANKLPLRNGDLNLLQGVPGVVSGVLMRLNIWTKALGRGREEKVKGVRGVFRLQVDPQLQGVQFKGGGHLMVLS